MTRRSLELDIFPSSNPHVWHGVIGIRVAMEAGFGGRAIVSMNQGLEFDNAPYK